MPLSASSERGLFATAARAAIAELQPKALIGNAVICVTAVAALLTTVLALRDLASAVPVWDVTLQIVAWLWMSVLFSHFAEALAARRCKARADSLRTIKAETMIKLLAHEANLAPKDVASSTLRAGQLVRGDAGDLIPTDAEVVMVGKQLLISRGALTTFSIANTALRLA